MSQFERPLVTFVLCSYNHGHFIKEALGSVLAQTYSPLEIIVSDDNSSDNTVALIEEVISAYSGRHKIIFNRRTHNRGLGAHVNELMEMASGELIVAGSGDDISMPHRVEFLVKSWLENRRPPALCSQAIVISKEGRTLADRFAAYGKPSPSSSDRASCIEQVIKNNGDCILLGCTAAWTRDIFRIFGPLREDVVHEDNAISLRAWLLGKVLFLDEPLVYYRLHDHNLALSKEEIMRSPSDFIAREQRNAYRQGRRRFHLKQHTQDLAVALKGSLINEATYKRYVALIDQKYKMVVKQAEWWGLSPVARLKAILEAISGAHRSLALWAAPRLFGVTIFAYSRSLIGILSRSVRRMGLR